MITISEFASNCPISRPINVGWKSDWDLGGLQWSHDWGMFFSPSDELVPLRKPPPRNGS